MRCCCRSQGFSRRVPLVSNTRHLRRVRSAAGPTFCCDACLEALSRGVDHGAFDGEECCGNEHVFAGTNMHGVTSCPQNENAHLKLYILPIRAHEERKNQSNDVVDVVFKLSTHSAVLYVFCFLFFEFCILY